MDLVIRNDQMGFLLVNATETQLCGGRQKGSPVFTVTSIHTFFFQMVFGQSDN